ncbi:MAG TPA: M67 family metallopeptidase [Alphaproteobacteria bacterium]|jgi:proteasome lid subunit RPN8/RPN11|nr:M67 family metallopeptidase [Alphaproteobacteria bacterium]
MTASQLRWIETACEEAYPNEACGLLVGRWKGEVARVSEVHASGNVAENPRRAFEVDPQLLLALHKCLRQSKDTLLGIYHSHPDSAALPSAHDLDRAWQPEMIWLITTVRDGRASETKAHRLADSAFVPFPLALEAAS